MDPQNAVLPVDMRPVWQQEFGGLSWADMPGADEFAQKCNFALFRRGLYDPEMDVVEPDAVQLREVKGEEDLCVRTTSTGKRVRLRGKKIKLAHRDEALMARQAAITARLAALSSEQLLLLKREFGFTLESIIRRALGRFDGRAATVCMRQPIMDRVEAALAALPELESRVQEAAQKWDLRQSVLRTRYIVVIRKAGRVQDRLVKLCDVSHKTVRTLHQGARLLRPDAIERLERGVALLENELAALGKLSSRSERRVA